MKIASSNEALEHFKVLERLYERQQQTPEVRRTRGVVEKEMLDDTPHQLSQKVALLNTLGPTSM